MKIIIQFNFLLSLSMENSNKRPGRKKVKPDLSDKAKGYNVSLKPSAANAIINKYGSLSKALKALLLTIPNPNAFLIKKD